MTAEFLATEAGRKLLQESAPTANGEHGNPADVAEVIGFLATMQTGHLLGQTIFVDGGSKVLLGRATA